MELPQFIEMQMRQFIDEQSLVEETKSSEDLVYRGDEHAGLVLQKDYESLIKSLLLNNQVGDATNLFDELKSKYTSIPAGNIYEKQVVFDVMQKSYDVLTEHINDKKQKEDILLRMSPSSNVFDNRIQPVQIKYDDVRGVVDDAVKNALKNQFPDKEKISEIPEPEPEPEPEPLSELEPSSEPEPEEDLEEHSVEPELMEPVDEEVELPLLDDLDMSVVDKNDTEPDKVSIFEEISQILDDVRLFIDTGRLPKAKDVMLSAKKILESLDESMYDDAHSLFNRYNDLKHALEDKYNELHGQKVKPYEHNTSVKKYKQGLVYFFKGNYDRAADYFKLVLDEQNDYLPAKIRLAECLERSKWMS